MGTPRLDSGQREFLSSLGDVVFGNPFTPERVALIRRLAPDAPQNLWSDREALARVVAPKLKPFLAGGLAGFDDEDRRLLEPAFLYVSYHRFLPQIDAHIERSGADAGEPEWPAPVALPAGPASLDLRDFGTVLWATGYTRAYPWLDVPVLDGDGQLMHREGITAAPGLYALGLRFQRTRRSHFIGGVGDDAARIADAISGAAAQARAA